MNYSAAFEASFSRLIADEGGFVDHTVAGDTGGRTFAGITMKSHPDWEGWPLVVSGATNTPALTQMVRDFYYKEFWVKISGDQLPPAIADGIFRFGVNASWRVSASLAQMIVGVVPDGIIGPKTAEALGQIDPRLFKAEFFVLKTKRYRDICMKNRAQEKFLLGWLNRIIGGL